MHRPTPSRARSAAAAAVLLTVLTACSGTSAGSAAAGTSTLPLTQVNQMSLPGDTSRMDYASLDPQAHQLFVAHLGADQIIQIDTQSGAVTRVIDGIQGVHGVLVVPQLHRVYATATDADQVVTLDQDTGAELSRAPTGAYLDGLAYDPTTQTIWVTDETGGNETVLDTGTGQVTATVDVHGDAGNVAYDPAGRILVAVQSRNQIAAIDPRTRTVTRTVDVPGCDHPHGLTLDPDHRVGFIACDGNATLHTLNLDTLQPGGSFPVGDNPDVLTFDPGNQHLYVASESGTVSAFTENNRELATLGQGQLADGAHVVAVDPVTNRVYFPIAHGPQGHPELLVLEPITQP